MLFFTLIVTCKSDSRKFEIFKILRSFLQKLSVFLCLSRFIQRFNIREAWLQIYHCECYSFSRRCSIQNCSREISKSGRQERRFRNSTEKFDVTTSMCTLWKHGFEWRITGIFTTNTCHEMFTNYSFPLLGMHGRLNIPEVRLIQRENAYGIQISEIRPLPGRVSTREQIQT